MKSEINFHIKPILEGEKVILRPFGVNDWEAMLPILEEAEVRRLTGSANSDEEANLPIPPEEAEKIKQWYQSRNEQENRLDLAIVERNSGRLVGEVVFNDFDEATHNVNFRILIGSSGRGKGLGTESIALFLRYGFEVLGFHKIELEVYSFNPRAERVYRKNGFVLEGVKREDFQYNGTYIDTKLFGMLRCDYKRNLQHPCE